MPVVCFVDAATGLTCDLCVNNTAALCNTAIVTSALAHHPPLLMLVQAIRYWTSRRGLRNVEVETLRHVSLSDSACFRQASLSSYTWTILCMEFLIRKGDLPVVDVQAAGIGCCNFLAMSRTNDLI